MTETVHAGDRSGPREMTLTGKDGRRFDVALSAAPILDGRDRATVGIVYVAHDITDRKRAEERLTASSEELRDANRRLEELDRVKSDLITIVSHE
jgi:PAS domain-containing protein